MGHKLMSLNLKVMCSFLLFFVLGSLKAEPLIVEGLPYPPYIIYRENEPPSGILVDLVKEVAKELNLELEFRISNWARAYDNVSLHVSDALIPTMKTPDRLDLFHFTQEPLLTLDLHLIANRNLELEFNGDYSSLKNLRVGRIRNSKVAPGFDQAVEQGVFWVEERRGVDQLIKGLHGRRLDLIALDWRLLGWNLMNRPLKTDFKLLHPALGKVPVYLAFSKERVALKQVQQINNALIKVKNQGMLIKLEAQYIPQRISKITVFESQTDTPQ